jgi:hypothetical protein
MRSLTFKYDKPVQIIMCVGFPILVALCVAFPCVSIYLLRRGAHLSLWIRLDAIGIGIIGLSFTWLLFTILRTWYAFFTVYVLNEAGINVRFLSSEIFLSWNQLSAVKYRQALGQIEVRFHEYPRLVVLNNVDMNIERKTLRAGLRLIEEKSNVPIHRTLV